MDRIILTVSLVALVLGGLAMSGCDRIPQICRDSCKQQERCDPGFSEYGYSVRQCRSDCEDSTEDQLHEVDDDCREAYLDYYDCVANLSCTELHEHDYTDCDLESLRMSQRCDDQ